jgi:hypothetical protein
MANKKKDQRARVVIPAEWFEQEVKFAQQTLALNEWDITVHVTMKFRPSGGEFCEGLCEPHDGHLTCKITLRQDVLKGEARYNVWHEIGHLFFRSWNLADQKVIDDMVPNALTDKVNEALEEGEEHAIERFAHLMVRLHPERKEPDGATV